jgi:uncharacterized protein (DUF1501 family)
MKRHRNCQGMTRRDSLKLGLGALGLAAGLQARMAAASPNGVPKANTRCILVWLDGGPSHYETFDPKPNAPAEIRGEFSAISTKIPGVQFSQHMTRLAAIADRISIIRSIRHDQGNHGAGNHYMMTGAPPRIPVGCGAFVSFHPSLGSMTAHQRGAPDGLPPYFSMPSMTRSGGPNFLGARFAPFVVPDDPNSQSFRVRDVALPRGLAEGRFADRHGLRRDMDTLLRLADETAADPVAALDDAYDQAHTLVTSPDAQAAFDIHNENDATRQRYGRHPFGQRVLLARRLVEAGVPFVTLHEGGWDHHTKIFESLGKRLPSIDATLATLIEDLDERGLLDETLVVVLGEFGRTPKINKDVGRDHWSNAMSVLMAGCGTPGGTIVGSTDRQGFSAVERVLSPENFVSTVYCKLGIDPGKILHTPQGRPVHIVSDPTPIEELMSS